MSKEITYHGRLVFDDGATRISFDKGVKSVSSTGLQPIQHVQNIATSYELVDLGDLTTPGFVMFHNRDVTNYVEIGVVVSATFYPLIKLLAGEVAGPFRLGTTAPYAQANTAACNLEYLLIEA